VLAHSFAPRTKLTRCCADGFQAWTQEGSINQAHFVWVEGEKMPCYQPDARKPAGR
jgi:hypothetical protein